MTQNSSFFIFKYLGIVLLVVLLLNTSCSVQKVIPSPTAFQEECLQGLIFADSEDYFLKDSLVVSDKLASALDKKALQMAYTLNLVKDLDQLLHPDFDRVEKLALNSKVKSRVLKLSLELQSLAAAIDCEEEKSKQIASYLEKELRKKERNLTVAAIITGAVVGVGTGVILASENSPNDWAEYVGIAGGLTEVFLGISILRLNRQISISHTKNILNDVYSSETRPSYFPPAVWYYFNSKNQDAGGLSLREMLIKRWETYNMNESGMSLLLSDGGAYSPELLKTRAEMLDQLESQLSLISKDLLYFLNQIDTIHSTN
jgi:hypothetical protein